MKTTVRKASILMILLSSFISAAYSQCSADIFINSDGKGGYTFTAVNPTDTDSTAVYHWNLYSDSASIFVDSNMLQTFFQIDTNGTYRICLSISDSTDTCSFDTCVTFHVGDAEYYPLLDTLNTWYLIYNVCIEAQPHGGNGSRSICENFGAYTSFYTGDDTTIYSTNYKSLYGFDIDISSYCLFGFIREDSVFRRIYFLNALDTQEVLLYDFSLKIGDSIDLHFQPASYDSGFYHVDSITRTQIQAGSRRLFYLSKNGSSLTWLEGVGSLISPVYFYQDFSGCPLINGCAYNSYKIPFNAGSLVVCYFHSDHIYFDSCAYNQARQNTCIGVGDSCYYYPICGGIKEVLNLFSFEVQPNPANNEAKIQLDVKQEAGFTLFLYNIDGRQPIFSQNLGHLSPGTHAVTLGFDHIDDGVYLVECRSSEGSLYKKLIIVK